MTDVPTIAIVEDDGDIRGQLAGYLEGEGFRVVGLDGGAGLDRHLAAGPASDDRARLDAAGRGRPLDPPAPARGGRSTCRHAHPAKDEDIDRVLGLEMGADDFVSKPFNPRLLLARIRAVQRRARGNGAPVNDAPRRLP